MSWNKLTIEKTPLAQQVLQSIRRGILSGRFVSGERLGEEEISSELGVSRHAVRLALSTLEAEGLVEGDAYKGKRVAELRSDQLSYLLEVRGLLEAAAVALAIERLTPDDIRRLQRYAQRLRDETDWDERIRLDLEFHEFIWSLSGDQRLQKLLRQVVFPFFAIQYRAGGRLGDWRQQEKKKELQGHQLLIEAICAKDTARARRLMKQHSEWANFDEKELSRILQTVEQPAR